MILTNSLSLLFIEPRNEKKLNRSNLTKYKWFKQVLNDGQCGIYNDTSNTFKHDSFYLGLHTCKCGETSASYDILLPNKMITNSLAYHYLVYHSDEVPEIELFKLTQLKEYIAFSENIPFNINEVKPK